MVKNPWSAIADGKLKNVPSFLYSRSSHMLHILSMSFFSFRLHPIYHSFSAKPVWKANFLSLPKLFYFVYKLQLNHELAHNSSAIQKKRRAARWANKQGKRQQSKVTERPWRRRISGCRRATTDWPHEQINGHGSAQRSVSVLVAATKGGQS